MATKQLLNSLQAPDGSYYVTLSDGAGNLFTGYPPTATPITASATGTTAAITATLPATAGKTTYITGLQITASGATAAGAPTATVSNTISGTLNYVVNQTVVTAGGTPPLVVSFSPAVPASAANTTIVATVTLGAGTTAGAVTVTGFQL